MQNEPFLALIAGLEAAGLSKAEIAEHAGISRDTIWRLETGTARQPTLDTYLRLGRCYERELGRPPPSLSFSRR